MSRTTWQPWPDAFDYADTAVHIHHGDGPVTTVDSTNWHATGTHPSRFGPGYPLLLAPFASDTGGAKTGTAVLSVLLPIAAAVAGIVLAGAVGGLLAVIFVAASPLLWHLAPLVMSDVVSAAVAVFVLACVAARKKWTPVAAGAIAAFGVTVHLPAVALLAALLVAYGGRDRWLMLAGAAPIIAALALWQWDVFGAPWRDGYGWALPGLRTYSLSFIWHPQAADAWPLRGNGLEFLWPGWGDGSNLVSCPLLLAGVIWSVTPPFGGLVGAWATWRRRASPVGRFVVVFVALTLLMLVPYFGQAQRLALPAGAVLSVMAAIGLAPYRYTCRAVVGEDVAGERALPSPSASVVDRTCV